MSSWKIHGSLICDKGLLCKNNEDAWYFNGKRPSFTKMDEGAVLNETVPAVGSLWAVCDGMGGQKNGETASYTAVSGLKELQEHLDGREFSAGAQNWVRQASMAVSARAEGGGTTLTMLYVTDGYLQTAHVGDSRVYRFHKGGLSRVTRDHSKVEMLLAAGMITEEEARNHPKKNVITRYLGMNDEYDCEASIGKKLPLVHGDRYLLCSDGVTDMVTDETLAALMAEEDTAACAEKIRDAVFAAGGKDNMTVLVLELEAEDGGEEVPEADAPLPQSRNPDLEPTEQGEGAVPAKMEVNIRVGQDGKCDVRVTGGPGSVQVQLRQEQP